MQHQGRSPPTAERLAHRLLVSHSPPSVCSLGCCPKPMKGLVGTGVCVIAKHHRTGDYRRALPPSSPGISGLAVPMQRVDSVCRITSHPIQRHAPSTSTHGECADRQVYGGGEGLARNAKNVHTEAVRHRSAAVRAKLRAGSTGMLVAIGLQ